jgi:hypothetical protein
MYDEGYSVLSPKTVASVRECLQVSAACTGNVQGLRRGFKVPKFKGARLWQELDELAQYGISEKDLTAGLYRCGLALKL